MKCSATIWIDVWQKGQCSKNAVIERDGKSYCKIHDPKYIEAKHKKRQAKYAANDCTKCGFHFYYASYQYCPLCGTKRTKLRG